MIDDLSKTLCAILTQKGLPAELASAQIVFDHPSEKFAPQQTTLNLFLYDIREDLELRSNEPRIERRNGDAITHLPPLRVACSYLVTAWPVGGADLALQEQRLLGQVLQVFGRLPKIPASFLQGALKGQTPPLPMVTALVDPQKNLSEFWTALGAQLRPSLTVTATFAMYLTPPETARIVTESEFEIGQRTAPDEEKTWPSTRETLVRIGFGGRVIDAANKPVAAASVTIPELDVAVKTDPDGRYKFALKRPGTYKLRVQKGERIQEEMAKVEAGTVIDVKLE
jgi:hypothetical protein